MKRRVYRESDQWRVEGCRATHVGWAGAIGCALLRYDADEKAKHLNEPTPIHDMVDAGMLAVAPAPAAVAGDEVFTTAVSDDVARAITEFNHRHTIELATVLAPLGLRVYDLAAVEYRRIVTPAEIVARNTQADEPPC